MTKLLVQLILTLLLIHPLNADGFRILVQLDASTWTSNGRAKVVVRNEGKQEVMIPLFEGRPQFSFEVWSISYGARFRRKSELAVDQGGGFVPDAYTKLRLGPGEQKEYHFDAKELSSGNEDAKLNSWLLAEPFLNRMRAVLKLDDVNGKKRLWLYSRTFFFGERDEENTVPDEE